MSKDKPARARKPAAEAVVTGPNAQRPKGGGSYVREPASGKLERVEATAQRKPRHAAEPAPGAPHEEGSDQQNSEPAGSGQQEG